VTRRKRGPVAFRPRLSTGLALSRSSVRPARRSDNYAIKVPDAADRRPLPSLRARGGGRASRLDDASATRYKDARAGPASRPSIRTRFPFQLTDATHDRGARL